MAKTAHLQIGERTLPVTNLDKVMYPQTGFTKADVIDYLVRISPVLLPHLHRRPLTLKRYPEGVDGFFFYEKKCPASRPAWMATAPMWSDKNEADVNYCSIEDVAGLVWLGNLADLELHTFLARSPAVDRPTMVVFDLDPGPPADIVSCCRVALELRKIFEEDGLESFPKTSGSKGLQVYVPFNLPRLTYDQTKTFARAIADRMEEALPTQVVASMQKSRRPGKVLIDWSQNDNHKTTVCVYSLRAKATPTVSTPVTWQEVARTAKSGKPEQLTFASDQVLKRVAKLGDLFAPVLTLKQKWPRRKR